jgi:putative effector of murein hydrolase
VTQLYSFIIAIPLTLVAYIIGIAIYRKTKSPFLNPIIVALLLITLAVKVTPLTWAVYISGSRPIIQLLPLTIIILALPLYRQLPLLKKHHKAILAGATAGVATSAISLFILGRLMGIDIELLRSILPKSITTPLGISLSQWLQGLAGITVISIVITGILGIVFYLPVFKFFKITHPIAQGVALGTASHAVGTSKAIELGEVEGAMSSLAILISGVITLLATPVLLLLISIY